MSSVVFLVALAAATALLSRWINRRRLNPPPGPTPDLIIGNIRQMPFENQEKAFFEWGKIYGDVIYTQILGRSMVILNSLKAARDLLEKRGAIYSCRPRLVLISELMGWHSATTGLPYGERLRQHRRWILDYFGEHTLAGHERIQQEAVAQMLLGLFETPSAFLQHTKTFSAGLVMRVVYGHKVSSPEDEYVRFADEAAEATITSGTSHGGLLVDFIPVLKYLPVWMPGAGFKRRALEARVKIDIMHDAPLKMVREKMASGDLVPSFTSTLLAENVSTTDNIYKDIRGVTGTMFAAAMDTTSASISAFFLAMVRNPNVRARAQAEIDAVIGEDRLPVTEDRPSLPYVNRVVHELYRWHIAAPLGVPHCLTRDDQYNGFDLPKDSMLVANAWAMSRDEEMYEDAHRFNPDRFAAFDSQDFAMQDPNNFIWGFGRRQCPGRDFADANIWLLVASVLAAFDLSAVVNDAGELQPPAEEFISGFIRHPKPFQCKITARNPQRARQIMELAFAMERLS